MPLFNGYDIKQSYCRKDYLFISIISPATLESTDTAKTLHKQLLVHKLDECQFARLSVGHIV